MGKCRKSPREHLVAMCAIPLILIAHLLRTSGLRNQSFCLSKKVLRIGVRNHLFSSAQALRRPIAHFGGRGGVSMMRG